MYAAPNRCWDTGPHSRWNLEQVVRFVDVRVNPRVVQRAVDEVHPEVVPQEEEENGRQVLGGRFRVQIVKQFRVAAELSDYKWHRVGGHPRNRSQSVPDFNALLVGQEPWMRPNVVVKHDVVREPSNKKVKQRGAHHEEHPRREALPPDVVCWEPFWVHVVEYVLVQRVDEEVHLITCHAVERVQRSQTRVVCFTLLHVLPCLLPSLPTVVWLEQE